MITATIKQLTVTCECCGAREVFASPSHPHDKQAAAREIIRKMDEKGWYDAADDGYFCWRPGCQRAAEDRYGS